MEEIHRRAETKQLEQKKRIEETERQNRRKFVEEELAKMAEEVMNDWLQNGHIGEIV